MIRTVADLAEKLERLISFEDGVCVRLSFESGEQLVADQRALGGLITSYLADRRTDASVTVSSDTKQSRESSLAEAIRYLNEISDNAALISGSALLAGEKCTKSDTKILRGIACGLLNTADYIRELLLPMANAEQTTSASKRDGLIAILNQARCLERRVVLNAELADRILQYFSAVPPVVGLERDAA